MINPEYKSFQDEYQRKLTAYQPVEMVYKAEKTQLLSGNNQFDTVFHHFMYDYVGNINDASKAPLMLREHDEYGIINYPSRMYTGFTDSGKLLLVRCSYDVPFDSPEQFYIATADLNTEQVSSWDVTELISRNQSGFECYMENQDGEEAHLTLGAQKIEIIMAGVRRPERVALLNKSFLDLLEYRRRLDDAPQIARMLMFMAGFNGLQSDSEPATIAA